jgi:large conductance mechanosensitive channel
MKGFVTFIRKQGVVGLAVGFILGGAIQRVITGLVTDIVNPLLGLLLGHVDGLKAATLDIAGAKVAYGDFLSILIDFVTMCAIVYFFVHGLRLDKLDKPKEDK